MPIPAKKEVVKMLVEAAAVSPVLMSFLGGIVATNLDDADPPLFEGQLQDEIIELRVEMSEHSEEEKTTIIGDRGPSDRGERLGSAQDGGHRGEDNSDLQPIVDLPVGENPLALYCELDSGSLDSACQSIANSVDCVVVAPVSPSINRSAAPFCLDETPEPVDDEEVIEAAVEAPEDDEPDVSVIIEQIPGRVAEEFATLPIDGGSVAFEEDLRGFGFINRHTNVFADVENQSFQRDMLGIDVEIRAVPIDYHFDYGDGTARTTAAPGRPAADAAGANDSAPTDRETLTSHIYQETGLYEVGITTTFTGEYRIAGGTWTPIADATTVEASPGQADIWRTQSRHVSGQCEDPDQWGCNGPFTIEGEDRPPKVFADQYDDAGNWRGP